MESNFFTQRRSVLARKMSSKNIPDEDLDKILAAGIRVPDHGALNPWKISVIKGDKLKLIDENIILTEFKKENPNASEVQLEMESKRFQRASIILAVLSTPIEHPKIPTWEMSFPILEFLGVLQGLIILLKLLMLFEIFWTPFLVETQMHLDFPF